MKALICAVAALVTTTAYAGLLPTEGRVIESDPIGCRQYTYQGQPFNYRAGDSFCFNGKYVELYNFKANKHCQITSLNVFESTNNYILHAPKCKMLGKGVH